MMISAPIPFQFAADIQDGDSCGNGILRIVTFANDNTDMTITHNLGWIPHMVMPLWVMGTRANPPATVAYTPKLKQSTVTAWTNTTVTIQSDTACTALLMWIV
jgi:hypothetical protein